MFEDLKNILPFPHEKKENHKNSMNEILMSASLMTIPNIGGNKNEYLCIFPYKNFGIDFSVISKNKI